MEPCADAGDAVVGEDVLGGRGEVLRCMDQLERLWNQGGQEAPIVCGALASGRSLVATRMRAYAKIHARPEHHRLKSLADTTLQEHGNSRSQTLTAPVASPARIATSASSAQPLQRRPASAVRRCRLLTEAPFDPEPWYSPARERSSETRPRSPYRHDRGPGFHSLPPARPTSFRLPDDAAYETHLIDARNCAHAGLLPFSDILPPNRRKANGRLPSPRPAAHPCKAGPQQHRDQNQKRLPSEWVSMVIGCLIWAILPLHWYTRSRQPCHKSSLRVIVSTSVPFQLTFQRQFDRPKMGQNEPTPPFVGYVWITAMSRRR